MKTKRKSGIQSIRSSDSADPWHRRSIPINSESTRPPSTHDAGESADLSTRWNAALAEAGGHLLQSWEWGEFKLRHAWTSERVQVDTPAGSGFAQILFKARGPMSIGYVPRGPVLTGRQDAVWPLLLDAISSASRSHRAILTIIEPNEPLGLGGTFREAGVVAGPSHIQPGRTVKVPLLADDELLKQMHQKTRYNVRLADKRGVEIERAEVSNANIDRFYALMDDTAQRNEFGIHSRAYYADFLNVFGDRACLLFASSEGNDAATIIAARFGREAIYMYGASSSTYRAHGAAFRLQYEAMRWARDEGSTSYDLWGIPDQDPESTSGDSIPGSAAGSKGDDWRGLYRFKTGFGGEIISYPPTIERRYLPIVPWVARRMNLIKG